MDNARTQTPSPQEARRAADTRYSRQRVQRLQHAGLCPACGHRPPAPARRLCAPCGAAHVARQQRYLARLKRAGLCLHCLAPIVDKRHTLCRDCRQWYQAYYQKHPALRERARLRAQRLAARSQP